MPSLRAWEISVGDGCLLNDEHRRYFLLRSDWGDQSSENNDRQMATDMHGEDWDREAHQGHMFNEDELKQLNG